MGRLAELQGGFYRKISIVVVALDFGASISCLISSKSHSGSFRMKVASEGIDAIETRGFRHENACFPNASHGSIQLPVGLQHR